MYKIKTNRNDYIIGIPIQMEDAKSVKVKYIHLYICVLVCIYIYVQRERAQISTIAC